MSSGETILNNIYSRLEALEKQVVLRYTKLLPKAKLYKKHDTDSCFDVFSTSVQYGENYIEYGTGLAFEIPPGYELKVYPRSSVSVTSLVLANSVGVIDEDYRGELMIRFKTITPYNFYMYKPGERVAQLQLVKKAQYSIKEVDEISSTERGVKGFGSTGVK